MTRCLALCATCAILVAGASPAADEDAVKVKLAAAKAAYAGDVGRYRAAVNAWFDKREEAARTNGDKKAVDQVKADRQAFADRGELPRTAPTAFRAQLGTARTALEAAFKTAVREHTKARNDDDAAAAEKELEAFRKTGRVGAAGEVPRADWVELFNGVDLKGWQTLPDDKAQWEVRGGRLVGSGPLGLLMTTRAFANYELEVEAMINSGGNSGVYLRHGGKIHQSGYEVQINSDARDPKRTGSLYVAKGKNTFCPVPVNEPPVGPDRWFTLTVRAEGNHLEVAVNGKRVAEYTDKDRNYSEGFIALQQHHPGSVASFRKVRLRELAAPAEK